MDQRRLGSWSTMQETKPGRTRAWPAKECARTSVNWWCMFLRLKTGNAKFLGFQMSTRLSQGFLWAFMLCESSLLGVWKIREGWSLQRAVFLEFFRTFRLCVTSRNTFLKTLCHNFETARNNNWIASWPDYFFPPHVKNSLGTRLVKLYHGSTNVGYTIRMRSVIIVLNHSVKSVQNDARQITGATWASPTLGEYSTLWGERKRVESAHSG